MRIIEKILQRQFFKKLNTSDKFLKQASLIRTLYLSLIWRHFVMLIKVLTLLCCRTQSASAVASRSTRNFVQLTKVWPQCCRTQSAVAAAQPARAFWNGNLHYKRQPRYFNVRVRFQQHWIRLLVINLCINLTNKNGLSCV